MDIVIIPEAMQVSEMVEDAARLKCLFAIIINTQNELHKSLTLNILHGTPQGKRKSVGLLYLSIMSHFPVSFYRFCAIIFIYVYIYAHSGLIKLKV